MQLNGFQTVPGQPNQILGLLDYVTPGCCPEGLLKYFDSSAGECCQDKMWQNPYRCGRAETRPGEGGVLTVTKGGMRMRPWSLGWRRVLGKREGRGRGGAAGGGPEAGCKALA